LAPFRRFLFLLATPHDRIAQDDREQQDPARCNQEQEPKQDANDECHESSYEHLPCHAQWPSHQDHSSDHQDRRVIGVPGGREWLRKRRVNEETTLSVSTPLSAGL